MAGVRAQGAGRDEPAASNRRFVANPFCHVLSTPSTTALPPPGRAGWSRPCRLPSAAATPGIPVRPGELCWSDSPSSCWACRHWWRDPVPPRRRPRRRHGRHPGRRSGCRSRRTGCCTPVSRRSPRRPRGRPGSSSISMAMVRPSGFDGDQTSAPASSKKRTAIRASSGLRMCGSTMPPAPRVSASCTRALAACSPSRSIGGIRTSNVGRSSGCKLPVSG